MIDIAHGRFGTRVIWNMRDMVHGDIVHGRYGTWKISYMRDMIQARYGT